MLPILTYHHISDTVDYYTAVKKKAFERQVATIAKEFTIITLRDALAVGLESCQYKVVITIDDGYADALNAREILSRVNASATLYIPTGVIGEDNKWNHKAPYIANNLTNAEITKLANAGYDIGSHGRVHQNLPKLSKADLEAEIIGSKEDLVRLLGPNDYTFCYPFGAHDERVRKLVKKHYSAGVATNKTCTNSNDISQLYRLSVNADTSIAQIMEYLHGRTS